MTIKEYQRAVVEAKRIIAFVRIRADGGRQVTGIKISKAAALRLIRPLGNDALIAAEWGDPDAKILFVG